MNITIVTENFIYYRSKTTPLFGGAEILLYEQAKLLTSLGHKVTVIQYGSALNGMGNKDELTTFEGIEVRQLKVPESRMLSRMGLHRRLHWGGMYWRGAVDSNTDRVHFHYYYLAFPCRKKWPWATSGCSHGINWDDPGYYRNLSLKSVRDRFSYDLMKRITRSCVGHLDKTWANDWFFIHHIMSTAPHLRDRLVHIPNYVDTDLFSPETTPSEEIRARFPGKKIILLPKMPSITRGTDIALDALQMLNDKDVCLVVVGDSSEIDYFRKLADKMNLTSQTWFTGHKDHDREMPAIYSAADIVIIPSPSQEATAISMLEGLAMRKPMVIANIGGLTEVAMDGFNSLVRRPDAQEFSNALRRLLADDRLAQELSDNAHDWMKRYYNKDIWTERIRRFYETENV
jgi:glycosyltransferase involved in cell wall biosynthesis